MTGKQHTEVRRFLADLAEALYGPTEDNTMTRIPKHCPDWESRRREELGLTVRIPRHLQDYHDAEGTDDFLLYTPSERASFKNAKRVHDIIRQVTE